MNKYILKPINNFIRFTSREQKILYGYIVLTFLYFFDMIITYRAFTLGYAHLESNWFIRNMLYSDILLYIIVKVSIIIGIIVLCVLIGKVSLKIERYCLLGVIFIYTLACISWLGYWRILLL